MEVKQKKTEKLSEMFLKYLIAFLVMNILVFGMLVFVVGLAMTKGILLPANYAEWAIEQVKEEIASIEEFDESLIPYTCDYVLIDDNKQILQSSLTEEDAAKVVKNVYKDATYSMKQYQMIDREKQSCIVVYDVMMHFAEPVLHKIFPKPELFSFVIFLLIAICVAALFARKLRKELEPILLATQEIGKQNLDFTVGTTKIKEFDTVLQSVSDMKDALQVSLKEQWTMEQHRKMQIAAITHDIKTPVTIVRGNAELLQESSLTLEQQESIESILFSVEKMEKYLTLLMAATKSEVEENLQMENVKLETFIQNIEKYAKAQCLAKEITFFVEQQDESTSFSGDFYADVILLERAIVNVIDNAVEFTPKHGVIKLFVKVYEEKIAFSILDSGIGFSKESMKHATQQFYTEKEERSGKHYGLGLFIAESVAKRHGGGLVLENNTEGCGAIVTLNLQNNRKIQ